MKTSTKLLSGCLLATLLVTSSSPIAHAGEPGPSAKMAARLKKRPTSAWLAHYLPDDRYKIAGGVWKYVSTDLDTFYHRPDSSLMLRQSANHVIGFASAAEAEEAGYKPGPGVGSSSAFSGGAIGTGRSEITLSKTEIKYLKSLDSLVDNMSGAPFLARRTGQTPSLARWVNGFVGGVQTMAKAPIPPRFAGPGQKIRGGLNSLVEMMGEMSQGNGQPNDSRAQAAIVSLAQGLGELANLVGPQNFNRYVSVPEMPNLPNIRRNR